MWSSCSLECICQCTNAYSGWPPEQLYHQTTWPSEVLCQTDHHLLLFVLPHMAVPNWPPFVALCVTSCGHLKCHTKLTPTCCSSCHFTWLAEVLCQTDHHLLLFLSLHMAVWSAVPNWTPLVALCVTWHSRLKYCTKLNTTCCSSCYPMWPSEVLCQTDHCLLLSVSPHMGITSAVPNWPLPTTSHHW